MCCFYFTELHFFLQKEFGYLMAMIWQISCSKKYNTYIFLKILKKLQNIFVYLTKQCLLNILSRKIDF